MAKRRPEADDLLRMAEHRRKMQALGRVAETAGRVATSGELRQLRPVGGPGADDPVDPNEAVGLDGDEAAGVVVSLAAARARRAGHPAGANFRR